MFQSTFDQKRVLLLEQLKTIESACEQVRTNTELHAVMKAVVQVGSRLLRRKVKAVTLDSLIRLAQVFSPFPELCEAPSHTHIRTHPRVSGLFTSCPRVLLVPEVFFFLSTVMRFLPSSYVALDQSF